MVWVVVSIVLGCGIATALYYHSISRRVEVPSPLPARDAEPVWRVVARELETMCRYMTTRLDNLVETVQRLKLDNLSAAIQALRREFSLLIDRLLQLSQPPRIDYLDDLVATTNAGLDLVAQRVEELCPADDPLMDSIRRSIEELVKGNNLIQRRVAVFKSALSESLESSGNTGNEYPEQPGTATEYPEEPCAATEDSGETTASIPAIPQRDRGDLSAAEMSCEELLEHVYETMADCLPMNRMGFAVLQRGRVISRWQRSDRPLRLLDGYSASLHASSLQFVAQLQRPRILNDLVRYLEQRPQSHSTRLIVAEGFRSSLTCPVVDQGNTIGFLFFSSDRLDAYGNADARVAMGIATEIAAAIRCALVNVETW